MPGGFAVFLAFSTTALDCFSPFSPCSVPSAFKCPQFSTSSSKSVVFMPPRTSHDRPVDFFSSHASILPGQQVFHRVLQPRRHRIPHEDMEGACSSLYDRHVVLTIISIGLHQGSQLPRAGPTPRKLELAAVALTKFDCRHGQCQVQTRV